MPDLQPPKFQPFTPRVRSLADDQSTAEEAFRCHASLLCLTASAFPARPAHAPALPPLPPQNALQQAMVRFRHSTDLGGGDVLLVTSLHPDWVPSAAELLASSFADSLAAALYKRYLQRQIKAYLEAHINLPPKAVVLAALRMPRELAEAAAAEAEAEAAQPAAAATALANRPSSSTSSMSTGADSGVPSSSDSSSSNGSGSTEAWPPSPLLGDSGVSAAQAGGLNSELSSCDDGMAAASPFVLQGSSDGTVSGSNNGSGSTDAAAAAAGPLATAGGSSLLAPGSGAVLTSVLELSFSPSTRSKQLTLQSPEVSACSCCPCGCLLRAARRD